MSRFAVWYAIWGIWLWVVVGAASSQSAPQHWYDDSRIYTYWEEPIGVGSDLHVNHVARLHILDVTPPFSDFAAAELIGAASGSIINTTQNFFVKRSDEPLAGWRAWPETANFADYIITYATVYVGDTINLNVTNVTQEISIANITYVTEQNTINEYVYISNTSILNVTEVYLTSTEVYNTYNTYNITEIFQYIYNQLSTAVDKEFIGDAGHGNTFFPIWRPYHPESVSFYIKQPGGFYMAIPSEWYDLYPPNAVNFKFIPIDYNPYTGTPLEVGIYADYHTPVVTQ